MAPELTPCPESPYSLLYTNHHAFMNFSIIPGNQGTVEVFVWVRSENEKTSHV